MRSLAAAVYMAEDIQPPKFVTNDYYQNWANPPNLRVQGWTLQPAVVNNSNNLAPQIEGTLHWVPVQQM